MGATSNDRHHMMTYARRNLLRRYRVRPIEFRRTADGCCHEGRMGDDSIQGMSFHSPVAMTKGDPIWVQTAAMGEWCETKRAPVTIPAVVCRYRDDTGTRTPGCTVGMSFCNGPLRPFTAADRNQPTLTSLGRPQERTQ